MDQKIMNQFWQYLESKRRFLILIFCLLSHSIYAQSLNTVDITTATLAALPNCLHYRVKGVCYWLTTAGVTMTTPYIEHYLPDVVVSVFDPRSDQNGGNPWTEIQNTLDQAGTIVEKEIVAKVAHVKSGGGEHILQNPFNPNVFFKEVDVIGNPAIGVLPTTPMLLHSVSEPYKPYYQSALDALLWHGFAPMALPEQTAALTQNLTHYIGSAGGSINWGGAYPIEGKVATGSEAKAAAVLAQRASDLITAHSNALGVSGHVYQSLPTDCGTECHASIIQENDPKTQFQMLYPLSQNSCQVFGQTTDYGEDWEAQANGAYVFILWRHYEGCIPGEGQYVGKTQFF